MEALLRRRLPVCGPSEHGGLGGGRVRQDQETGRAQDRQPVCSGADNVEERTGEKSVKPLSVGWLGGTEDSISVRTSHNRSGPHRVLSLFQSCWT